MGPNRSPAPEVVLQLGAFGAALTANLIHNDLGLDPAIAPAAVLTALYWRRPRRGLLWAAAVVTALPSFLFLRWSALGSPAAVRPFFNHLALLVAGVAAVLAVLVSFRRLRGTTQPQSA